MRTEETKSIQVYKKKKSYMTQKETRFLIENHRRSYDIMPANEENYTNLAFNRHQLEDDGAQT